MKKNRRQFLIDGTTVFTLLGLGFFPACGSAIGKGKAWQQSWFESGKNLEETFAALGVRKPIVDQKIVLKAPDTAENGAYVGINIESSIPNIDAVAFLVDKNPIVLSGYFEIKRLEKLKLGTKIKMAETSDLIALVKAGDNYFMNTRHVKVVLGGCGS
ncbi:thiosulfate oxidation carrier protein SoxY [Betaproteobacteria bacterium]|nr:thiosulfate oxidation carrier protein SoxY [Betaproteobacteria bacterium]